MKCHIIHRNVAVFSMNSVYLGNTYMQLPEEQGGLWVFNSSL